MNRPVFQRALSLTTYVRTMCASKRRVIGDAAFDRARSVTSASKKVGSSLANANAEEAEVKSTRKSQSRARNVEILKRKKDKPLHPNQGNARIDSQRGVEMFLDIDGGAGFRRTGRSWKPSELRLKSFDDLHRLWYILVLERNVLLTERAWCKTNGRHWVNGMSNLHKVRHSMARVKGVIAERVRASRAQRARDALQSEADGLSSVLEHSDGEPTDNDPRVTRDGDSVENDTRVDEKEGHSNEKKEGQHKNVNKNWAWKRRNEVSKSGTPLYI